MRTQAAPTRAMDVMQPAVSVLIPTRQGMEFLERVFESLSQQVVPFNWDVYVVDSSSTDGTWEWLRERQESFPVPLRIEQIHPVEFDHGETRNLLAARSSGALLVYLTQDAVPGSSSWLDTLVRNFDDPQVGAAYCRNVPRHDASPLTKVLSMNDPSYGATRRETRLPKQGVYADMSPHQKRQLYEFNDVASAIRRELWELHPFPRTPFGEDVLMARAMIEAHWTVVYDADATVEHSRDYSPEQTRARARLDGQFNAEWLDRICVASKADAATLTKRHVPQDVRALREFGLDGETEARCIAEAVEQRRALFEGLWEGGRSQRRRPATRFRETPRMRLLYVVHGFPPETWAGTEVYTRNIAKEMMRRGHEVTVLTRTPARGDEPEYSITEDSVEGLRVLRMTHRLAHVSLGETYLKPEVEPTFRRVLNDLQPDLVHFQHLIHWSVSLVGLAKQAGCATVVTCHDFWGLCSRVQMIRPDGSICSSNMGSGCYVCVKGDRLDRVERAAKRDGVLGTGRALKTLADRARRNRSLPKKIGEWANEYFDMRAREVVVPAAYAEADLRISPSRFLRSMYLASGHFDPESFLFSDNGLRTDHVGGLNKIPDARGRLRFGFVGTLVWYKGCEVLLRAFQMLVADGLGDRVHLSIHGGFDAADDSHRHELENLAQDGSIEFHGAFDNGRISEVFQEIDVLIVPSIWFENAPITIHEAFLLETPVITSNIGGMAEYVRDGVDGLYFEVGDAADLAAKMTQLVEDPALLVKLSSSEWMKGKSVLANGDETEARYRALCTIDRSTA